MAPIPADVDAIISRIDRQRDYSLLPRTDAAKDKYDRQLQELVPQYKMQNLTEFDYGRAFRYRIVLSTSENAASLDKARLASVVREHGFVDAIHVDISAVSPYSQIRFVRYVLKDGQLSQAWSTEPFSPDQGDVADSVLEFLERLGFRQIDPTVADTPVPGVSTELTAPDNATVADCLFNG